MSRNTTPKVCSFPGCGRQATRKSLCPTHYQQQKAGRQLVPIYSKCRPFGSPPIILFDEIECPNPALRGPCHIFKGGKNKGGYGQVCVMRRQTSVHRYVWERDVGPIPEGMQIDHQCRNRACCNIDHLRVVTPKMNATENIVGNIRLEQAKKTHCVNGHEFTIENTKIHSGHFRKCRACDRIRRQNKKLKMESLCDR